MSENFFNELHEGIKKFNPEENEDESATRAKGCIIGIWLLSTKLFCTFVLLWIAWIAMTPLWYSIFLSIIAAVLLLLPNTRDNQTMGWVRLATAVIAILFYFFFFELLDLI